MFNRQYNRPEHALRSSGDRESNDASVAGTALCLFLPTKIAPLEASVAIPEAEL
ncbi:MAG: hypothetical protein ACI93T_003974 [Porticoccaceae bacterium]